MKTALPPMPKTRIDGVALPVSRLILGCDNKDTLTEGEGVWDHWLERGGNAFDTAYVYGGGKHEAALGDWIAARGLGREVVVIGKGGHTPHCTPEGITTQLTQSLERLQIDHVPIYILHRDNPDVPVGEFVDCLNGLRRAGKIGVWGGSNWTIPRFDEAVAYAKVKHLQPPTILNNNLSLATMERAVWPGCLTSNTPESLAWLRASNTVHVSWSSQARGYFLPEALRHRLPADTAPESCFGSRDNEERRRRAEALAERHGVSANNIAMAWVLAQNFPSLALVGPRTIAEIDSTLPGLGVSLSAAETAWLNLEV